MPKNTKIVLIAIVSVCILLFMPSISAVKQSSVKESLSERTKLIQSSVEKSLAKRTLSKNLGIDFLTLRIILFLTALGVMSIGILLAIIGLTVDFSNFTIS